MTGNPNTVRSYLYPTDLTTWLLKCLANPSLRPMNIGGEIGVTMLELAIQVSELTSNLGVDILNPSAVPSRYVPSTQNAQQILGVSQKVSLVDGLERWIRWIENPRK
jgi:nucleoside-diphosphate-sugar epimerase